MQITKTETERTNDEKVVEYLHSKGFFEDESESIQRERVLGKLSNLVNKFIMDIAKRNQIPIDKKSLSKIFTFGSYRLGVHSSGADIDTLCVVPNFVSRNEFFTTFYDELCSKDYITEISKVTNTFVPLIKFKIKTIPIDLVFARVDLPSISPNIDLLNNKLLKHMSEKCILSLNGNRVTDEILAQVPNISTFHKTLRFIKYWAQKRQVYGHSYGYMGGVAYALCVAKVCQLYPGADAFETIEKFFDVFSKWPWPQPVIIKEVPDCNYNLKVWNPKINPQHKNDKMPVITPVYPPLCSTHNITNSTLFVAKKEFLRGVAIFSENADKKDPMKILDQLCEDADFFTRHKTYFMIALACDNPKEFSRFMGFAETRVRMFAQKLENIENIEYAYTFPKKYILEDVTSKNVPLLKELKCGDDSYAFGAFFIGIDFSTVKLPLNASKKMNLKKPVLEFKSSLETYEQEEDCEMRYEAIPMKQKALAPILSLFAPKDSLKRKFTEETEENRKK
ncbi:poly(A) polymerase [Nematocida parisii]|uniref:Poly(A) polymerase n=1 Tax=Nematocida parisii (strain ERTm3) TaxID=935791 RepID=I3EJH0_NEMP3|nr:poly(A) polymerase [Nematocida parisii ERTm1]EIJ89367.1 poly(A) polymerase [Nematocida parisii ERTm3]KAI5127430.1 poly(A) polymerase [Nematocida parisii]EIJ94434.1 poly(A) polymerase [Nematocida parisii ERTm1]KAI5129053.1 poly(A) polymerase [Nematocida parisii]KAI5141327.1 poly(A) polymerase [Nematocida parisii]|eukprot:XP_013058930.1 poly(A) polymerase [Nematocida parisii ERTm1]